MEPSKDVVTMDPSLGDGLVELASSASASDSSALLMDPSTDPLQRVGGK
jgi:hypothetical protein